MKKYTLLIVALVFKINLAFSDILFIDLNLNNKEVKAAQKAATERGEKLVIYPDLSSEVRSEIENLKFQIHKDKEARGRLRMTFFKKISALGIQTDAWERTLSSLKENPQLNQEKINELERKISQHNEEKNKLRLASTHDPQIKQLKERIDQADNKIATNISSYREKSKDTVVQELSNLVNSNNFSSFVMSGHHATNYFSDYLGKNLSMGDEDFKKIFSNAEKNKEMKSVHLWGCYANTPQSIAKWKALFPNLLYTSGWSASAPKEDKAIDTDFLYRTLVKMKNVEENATMENTLNFFQSVPQITAANASYSQKDCYVEVNHGQIKTLNLVDSTCPPAALEAFLKSLNEINNYAMIKDGYDDVPNDSPNTILRRYIANIRGQSKACIQTISANHSDLAKYLNPTYPFLTHNKDKVRPNFFSVFAEETKAVWDTINSGQGEGDKELKKLNLKCDITANRKELSLCVGQLNKYANSSANSKLLYAYAEILEAICLDFPTNPMMSENINWFEVDKMTKEHLTADEKGYPLYRNLQEAMSSSSPVQTPSSPQEPAKKPKGFFKKLKDKLLKGNGSQTS